MKNVNRKKGFHFKVEKIDFKWKIFSCFSSFPILLHSIEIWRWLSKQRDKKIFFRTFSCIVHFILIVPKESFQVFFHCFFSVEIIVQCCNFKFSWISCFLVQWTSMTIVNIIVKIKWVFREMQNAICSISLTFFPWNFAKKKFQVLSKIIAKVRINKNFWKTWEKSLFYVIELIQIFYLFFHFLFTQICRTKKKRLKKEKIPPTFFSLQHKPSCQLMSLQSWKAKKKFSFYICTCHHLFNVFYLAQILIQSCCFLYFSIFFWPEI